MSRPRKIVFILCLAVFVISGFMLCKYYIGNLLESGKLTDMDPGRGKGVMERLEALYEKNNDFVGWIKIKDTKVNYPVMQSSKKEPEFYLYRGFDKEYSDIGTPFIDVNSDIRESSNFLIYGHNIRSGQVFHDLLKYEEKSFWKKHRKFFFNNLTDGESRYEVVAAAHTKIYPRSSNRFKYYDYAYIDNEYDFDVYVAGVKNMAHYDTGIEPEFGDKMITLSTCAYHTDNGRFIVLARKTN